MEPGVIELTGIGIIFVFAVKEFFGYLKVRTNGNENGLVDGKSRDNKESLNAIFNELNTMNNNHLHSIQEAIEVGNKELVDVIHRDNIKMIELLAEIKGHLAK